MNYVYILKSSKDNSLYIGTTKDLSKRVNEHNSGDSRYTSSKAPFKLIWYCSFIDKTKAYNFERYLKSSSGAAFMNKPLVER